MSLGQSMLIPRRRATLAPPTTLASCWCPPGATPTWHGGVPVCMTPAIAPCMPHRRLTAKRPAVGLRPRRGGHAGLGRVVSPAINELNGYRLTGPATLGGRTGVIAERTSDPDQAAQAYVWAAAQCAEGRRIFYVTSDNQLITVTTAPSLFLWAEALDDPWTPAAGPGQYIFELGCLKFSPSPAGPSPAVPSAERGTIAKVLEDRFIMSAALLVVVSAATFYFLRK